MSEVIFKERPILYNTAMVQAILDERKTNTRRVLKTLPLRGGYEYCFHECKDGSWEIGIVNLSTGQGEASAYLKCPYGKPGDRLWVRETFWQDKREVSPAVMHADGLCVYHPKENCMSQQERITDFEALKRNSMWRKRPSIFMPRWACRILLEITEIRVERVQDISVNDCMAEGIDLGCITSDFSDKFTPAFRNLWDSINAKRGYGWQVNPWVWVVGFKRI